MTSPEAASSLLAGVWIDGTTKGFPAPAEPVSLADVPALGWTARDLAPPNLVLRRSALEHNARLMTGFASGHGLSLAPHGKVGMAPQLWWMQLDAGAWGISAASSGQARVMRAAGVRRVLIANELADDQSIRWVASELAVGDVELVCQVDSDLAVDLLEDGLREAGTERSLPVLVELGHPGGRTGCRDVPGARAVADRVYRSPRLRLAGVTGYEGTLAHDRSPASLLGVRVYLDDLRALADELVKEGAFDEPPILSAGGSMFFDLAAERLATGWSDPVTVLIRAGSYLPHDHGIYEASSPFANEPPERRFRPAIEAWGAVVSTPEPGLAILGLGRRDVPFDQGYPRPLRLVRGDGSDEPVDGLLTIKDLNDQHAYCQVDPDVSVGVGDVVRCGVSHPCTALDKWRVIPVLDDEDRVVDGIATFF